MMILRSSPASPYARKVRIAAAILGLSREIEVHDVDLMSITDTLRHQNPLGKIPTLIDEDEVAYYDSRVILEYLDDRAGGGRIIPRSGPARFEVLRLQALSDGISDAALLQVYEARYRPADKHVASWLEYQGGKVQRALAALEVSSLSLDQTPHVGQIALACALGYLDLRFAGSWRQHHPQLAAWHGKFAAQVPAYAETEAAS